MSHREIANQSKSIVSSVVSSYNIPNPCCI